jgi:hypothetical protein
MTSTPLQRAIMLAVPAYRASLRLLKTREERDALRDVLATAIAKDYLREGGLLDDKDGNGEERAA